MTNKPTAREEFERTLLGMDKDEIEDENGWWENTSGVEFGTKKKAAILSALDTFLEAIAVQVQENIRKPKHQECSNGNHEPCDVCVATDVWNRSQDLSATIIRSHKKV